VNRVLRKVERIAKGDVPGGQFDLRRIGLFGAGRENDGTMVVDAQFEMAQESSIQVKEADVGRAGRLNVPGHGRRQKGLPVDQRKVVDLTRLDLLIRDPRLQVR
jgi:hypothetical protein